MVALKQTAYTLASILGELLRSQLFLEGSRKIGLYSGPFVFVKLKPTLSPPIVSKAKAVFSQLINPVRNNS